MAIFRVTTHAAEYGLTQNNVLHFHKTDAVAADMGFLATRISERWVAALIGIQSERVSYNRIHIDHVDDETPFPSVDLGISRNGTFFNSENFPMVTAVFQLRTATGGRHGRGRFYLSGMYNDLTGGFWNSSQMVRFMNVRTSLMEWWFASGANFELEHGGFELVVAPRTDPLSFLQCIDIVPRGWAGTQVRRNFFRGV